MLQFLDRFLDRLTMYRLLLYYLVGLLAAAALLSQFGFMHYSPLAIVFSAAYLVAVCWASNLLFASVFSALTNRESSIITALILALIISPASSPQTVLFLTAAGGLAMASKYLLAIHKKHIFNPAAIAVILTGLGAAQTASWWVGSAPLLPFVLVGGFLVVRKVNSLQMVLIFVLSSYLATTIYTALAHGNIATELQRTTLNSALFFLAFVMLTEPMTSPRVIKKQRWYGVLVGVLLPPQVHLGALYSTPELALIVGNVFAFVTSPLVKLFPTLREKIRLSPNVVDFVFTAQTPFSYLPGQYMELTIPHKQPDSRGDRRYFTLASSPTEPEIRFGVKFYEDGSSYKDAMLSLDRYSPVVAAQLGGDFVLPADPTRKLVFIAGGIGITPFRSMLKYLVDSREKRDITMLYAASSVEDIVYADVLEAAGRQVDTNVLYCISDPSASLPSANYRAATITAELISREIPDYEERLLYLAGSHAMVNGVRNALHELGVSNAQIKVDFFPGYV